MRGFVDIHNSVNSLGGQVSPVIKFAGIPPIPGLSQFATHDNLIPVADAAVPLPHANQDLTLRLIHLSIEKDVVHGNCQIGLLHPAFGIICHQSGKRYRLSVIRKVGNVISGQVVCR